MNSLIKRIKSVARSILRRPKFIDNSKSYWEERYVKNKNSGPGSYGRLAQFKADVLNEFVSENNVASVLEFGCGDGNQLRLARYPEYIGFDVSEKAIELCENIFEGDTSKKFYLASQYDSTKHKAELTLSLDVIYHLIEDEVFHHYMADLFHAATRFVIIYSSNYNGYLARHVKCRKFTSWIKKNVGHSWKQKAYIKNKYPFSKDDPNNTSMADFYIYEKIS